MNKQSKMAIIAIAVVIPLVSLFVWSSDPNNNLQESSVETKGEKIQILASFYPLYEFTKEVGKDKVDVSVLVSPGVEPHDWEPTVKDIQKMQNADLVIINGLGFEQWVKDVSTINQQVKMVDTSFGITPIRTNSDSTDESELNFDPHIWLNPQTIKIQVINIASALKEADPENSEYYTDNTKQYLAKIDSADKEIREELAQCSKKDFIAFHDAFSYFAKEYSLNQHTVVDSLDPFGDPSPRNIENVINTARELDIKIIFTEEFVNPKMSQVIADELGGQVLVLSPLEIQEEGKTFLDRLKENKENLKKTLCD
ncbi:metal ABC transporter substrate-binding protein [Nitrosopumilus ureiphilus]|uniref:ABC transporter substrate-binding protein n=1 Tax=Nitrosopumilus ureiphilus TaxID=1470067 RepID=A0A7D5RAB8_9ARCH|nr:zinc ABC transporter substrate-binding protein [Nitrosopumilus ureiphilus]QLH05942.1 ABC transporter substrate-binding protein [Nitrosopumilus ureiphilus]